MSTNNSFVFNISPEPRYPQIDITEGNSVDIVFTVQNLSQRPVRVEAIVNPLEGPASLDSEPLPAEAWGHWLTIVEAPEWDFDDSSVRTFTVRLTLPEQLRLGTYHFQLLIVGIDEPDQEFAASDVVSFTVVGPELEVRGFVIGALVVLVAIILLAVGAAILFKPAPKINVEIKAPATVTVGQVATYTITVENARSISATNVVLDYTRPDGLIGATAFVPEADFRHCDETGDTIYCDLDTLGPEEPVTVTLHAIPGPLAGEAITNTGTVTVTGELDGRQADATVEVDAEKTAVMTATGLSVAIDPSVGIATLEEPVTYRLLAWNNITATERLTITYTLPQGMRYFSPLPDNCKQDADYFTLICPRGPLAKGKVATITVKAIPFEVSAGLVSRVKVEAEAGLDQAPVEATTATRVVNSALVFDGVNDWVELDYQGAPKEFTAEMWLQPISNDDGQAFIGAHRQEGDDVLNMFLVGYYNDGLTVTLNDTIWHTLDGPKLTERYHLKVVVEPDKDSRRSMVWVYINGKKQPWQEPDKDCPDDCKFFETVLDGGSTLPWVLGQDRDPGPAGSRPSDFFHGTLSEVRLWNRARTGEDILDTKDHQLLGNEAGLIGYWRLTPLHPDPSMLIADRTAAHYDGHRIGANWDQAVPRFGGALAFDGLNDVLTTSLRLSNLIVTPTGQLEVTLAGWIHVDGIPTEAQWIMGSAAPSSTVSLPTGAEAGLPETAATETAQSDLAAAQTELNEALQARRELDMDFDQARTSLEEAQDALYLTLWPLIEDLPDLAAVRVVREKALNTLERDLDAPREGADIEQDVQALDQALDDLKPWLKNQLDTDATASLFPELSTVTGAQTAARFDVVLMDVGHNKVEINKVVRMLPSDLSPTEVRDLVDSAPVKVLEGATEEEAANAKAKLEAAGATVLRSDVLTLKKLLALWAIEELQTAQANLAAVQTADARVDAAQEAVDQAQVEAERLAEEDKVTTDVWAGLIIDEDGHVAVVAKRRSSRDWSVVEDEKPIASGRWVHYAAAISYDATSDITPTLKLYRNGDKVKAPETTAISGTMRFDSSNCPAGFYIGGLCGSTDQFYFEGQLDEVRVWPRTLTVTQTVTQTKNEIETWRNLPGVSLNEYAYWPFDDGPGRTSAVLCAGYLTCDRSPNKFNIKVVGPTWIESDIEPELEADNR